jgi:secreted trypsin-like serine protease
VAAVILLLVFAPGAQAVVGGKETDRAWPWMTQLEYNRGELESAGALQQCGASLIAPRWVVTAAHCLEQGFLMRPELLAVVVGRHGKAAVTTGERIQVAAIHRHPLWDESKLDGYDLALLELARPAKTPPIRIAGRGEEALWANGVSGVVLGWGNTQYPGLVPAVNLKEATLRITDPCSFGVPYDAATSLCTLGPPDAGVCGGDSGGPFVVAAGGEWRLVGVLSWAVFDEAPCEMGRYAGFDKLASPELREWIEARVPEAYAPDVVPPAAPTALAAAAPAAAPAPAPAAPLKVIRRGTSKAYARCLKKAGKSKRRQRACRRAEAARQSRA